MINIENAKKEFLEYVKNYDSTNPNIHRKIYHSLRVMECSKAIAESLNLNEEQVDLATLIGLLHDIARFKQYKIYNSFSDKNIDHGDNAIKILEEDNIIRKFIKEDKYDDIIKNAIRNHNKFKIQDGLDEMSLVYSKIIRDADKLDIFYEGVEMFWETEEEKQIISQDSISKDYLEKVKLQECILKTTQKRSLLDRVVFIITLIFDINFKYSFKYILENDFVNKILDKFVYEKDSTRNQIEIIKKSAIDYINQNL